MRVKQGFVLCETDGKYVAVATGPAAKQFHGLITMNKSGKLLWELLAEHKTEQELTEALLRVCRTTPEAAAAATHAFVAKMHSAGILELAEGEVL